MSRLIWISGPKSAGYGAFLITSKVLDARRRGATTEAYGAIRRKEERSDDALMVDQGYAFEIDVLTDLV
jgi:hypothetical protein